MLCILGYWKLGKSKSKNVKHNYLLHFDEKTLSLQEPQQNLNILWNLQVRNIAFNYEPYS